MLVTRPQQQAAATAGRLAGAGFTPLVLPLSETIALPAATVPDVASYAAVAVTSANAIAHAQPALLDRLAHLKCYAVGSRTGEAASVARFKTVQAHAGNAVALAAHVADAEEPESRILYLCGRVRRPDFEAALAERGLRAEPVETYDTHGIRYTDDAIADMIGWNPIWGATVYSPGGAERLAEVMDRPELAVLFAQTRFFCLSERVAASLGGGRSGHIRVAGDATEDAMMEAIRAG